MPVMDGRRATELIRHWEHQQLTKLRATLENPPEGPRPNLLPIVFVTGNVMPGEEALMLSSGATKVRPVGRSAVRGDTRADVRFLTLQRIKTI
jgi:CheY-like chemotaxis protein